jgi:hypothetical protein
MTEGAYLKQDEWEKLIRDIKSGYTIPVIGPEFVTVADPENGGDPIPIGKYLAPKLAQLLQLKNFDRYSNLNDASWNHLIEGGRTRDVYSGLRTLLAEFHEKGIKPAEHLLSLAKITDFSLFINMTFDTQLQQALTQTRHGFDAEISTISYMPSEPVDLPDAVGNKTILYQLMGNHKKTWPEFAVWDEDYLEFIFGLIENKDLLRKLFQKLKNSNLLFLGSPASDWIVRFFLRITRGSRLSSRGQSNFVEYLAGCQGQLDKSLIIYSDKVLNVSQIINGCPIGFVNELYDRWNMAPSQANGDREFIENYPEKMPNKSVFISYARENLSSAVALARTLQENNVPVWLDKQRLKAGQDYNKALQDAVRVRCWYFISLISPETEADKNRERFVHKERNWAANRHQEGFVFYIPVLIHDLSTGQEKKPKCEPNCFEKINYHHAPYGKALPPFVRHMMNLWNYHENEGCPPSESELS